jgi:hypothetical protein
VPKNKGKGDGNSSRSIKEGALVSETNPGGKPPKSSAGGSGSGKASGKGDK